LHRNAARQRIRFDLQFKPFHLRALRRGQRLRGRQHPYITRRKCRAGETEALFQFCFRKGVPIPVRWRRYDARYDLHPAPPACAYSTAHADEVNIQQARAFQETVPFRTAAASSHRFEFYVVQGFSFPSKCKSLPYPASWEALHIYNLLFAISVAFSAIPLRSGCIHR
jgi:hypothetical protein